MVGLLIGKGGENLKKIERMSGVSKVQFAPGNNIGKETRFGWLIDVLQIHTDQRELFIL